MTIAKLGRTLEARLVIYIYDLVAMQHRCMQLVLMNTLHSGSQDPVRCMSTPSYYTPIEKRLALPWK